jgi:hypothetical protein
MIGPENSELDMNKLLGVLDHLPGWQVERVDFPFRVDGKAIMKFLKDCKIARNKLERIHCRTDSVRITAVDLATAEKHRTRLDRARVALAAKWTVGAVIFEEDALTLSFDLWQPDLAYRVSSPAASPIHISPQESVNVIFGYLIKVGLHEAILDFLGMDQFDPRRQLIPLPNGKAGGDARGGTCGICSGRYVVNARGAISLHGYLRPGDGWLRGRCIGSHFEPWEVSPQACEAYLARLVRLHRSLLKRMEKIPAHDANADHERETRKIRSALHEVDRAIAWAEQRIQSWIPPTDG